MSFPRHPVILWLTAVSFNCMYIPQPLLPLFSDMFHADMQTVSLMITLTMVCLGTSPVFYGVLTEKISPRTILIVSCTLLALNQFFFAWVARLDWMIASRVFQGLLFPAIFTALTTYISSKSNTLHTARNIRQYIFCTIIGGFTGRFFSGWFATLYGWTFFFNFSGALLLASIPGILYLEGNTARAKERFSFTSVRTTLADPLKLNIYLMIFSGFFVFTAVINYIPFRIREILPDASPQMIAVAYLGYLGGLISLLSAPLLRRTPRITEKILIPASVLGSLCGLAGLFMPFYALIGIFTLLFCASFFMLHGLSSGYINQISQIHKGTANGLYIAFYYSGGTLGSILPGFIYRWADWTWFITALLAVTVFQFYLSFRLSHRISP